jgi:membrane protein implicated in regulation of membrane protease activity
MFVIEDSAMPWWGWVIFGAILLGSELLVVDVAFYLVFIGVAAIITGLIGLAGIGLEPWAQWLVFATLGVISMVVFRERLYKKLRGASDEYDDGLMGEIIRLEEPLNPGASCRLTYRGSTWTVANRGSSVVEADTEVRIDRVEGLTLVVSGSE